MNYRKISANAAALLLERMVRIIAGVFITAYAMRHYGPQAYGNLAYALSICSILQVFVTLGLDRIVVRDLAQNPSSTERVLFGVLSIRVVAGIVAAVVLLIFTSLHHAGQSIALVSIYLAASLVLQATDTFDLWNQSRSESVVTVRARIVGLAVASAARLYCVLGDFDIKYFASTYLIEIVVTGAIISLAYHDKKNLISQKIDWAIIWRLLGQGWPLLLSSVSIALMMKIDQIFLANYRGTEVLGVYVAGTQLSVMSYMIPVILVTSLAPFISRAKVGQSAGYTNQLVSLFRAALIVSTCIIIGTYICAPLIVHLLYGQSYAEATSILRIHILTFLPVSVGTCQTLWTINENKTRLEAIKSFVGLSTALIFNYFLTPTYGGIGAAISCVLAQMCATFLPSLLLDRRLFWMQLGIKKNVVV